MFVQIQDTPNPNTLKFITGSEVTTGDSIYIKKNENKGVSGLADKILQIEGISSVFLSSDFISATKDKEEDWDNLKTFVISTIVDYLVSGLPIITKPLNKDEKENGTENEIVLQIKELIDTKVRPAVMEDGGDIVYNNFKDGIVYLELHGACSGCPSSTITLKNGIENMLKHYIPEVTSVEAI